MQSKDSSVAPNPDPKAEFRQQVLEGLRRMLQNGAHIPGLELAKQVEPSQTEPEDSSDRDETPYIPFEDDPLQRLIDAVKKGDDAEFSRAFDEMVREKKSPTQSTSQNLGESSE
ncbi:MAG TPA: hypothetical protein VLY24_25530, partial [Bryobacteraceae bacterium]|nr:hypothetical protein [Bryobacteraceae bacterium]